MASVSSRRLSLRRISVAPMLDWTDRHCRYFHRLLTRQAWLYSEMVTTGALLHGDAARHLDFNDTEHPVALQLGGSDPVDLAQAARLGAQWGYDEINLNCGCPSERVQRGAFGACLMAEPRLVADGVKAMCDAVHVPVTVKHRIGIDAIDNYGFVRDFVGTVATAGCSTFIVHARNAILKGLSPKENREVPPLRYEIVYRLKRDFPQLELLINGGFASHEQVVEALEHVDGVMVGREVYHNPAWLTSCDARYYDKGEPPVGETLYAKLAAVEDAMCEYAAAQVEQGVHLGAITRHMLGLYRGMPGARLWRRHLSDSKLMSQARNADAVRRIFAQAKELHEQEKTELMY